MYFWNCLYLLHILISARMNKMMGEFMSNKIKLHRWGVLSKSLGPLSCFLLYKIEKDHLPQGLVRIKWVFIKCPMDSFLYYYTADSGRTRKLLGFPILSLHTPTLSHAKGEGLNTLISRSFLACKANKGSWDWRSGINLVNCQASQNYFPLTSRATQHHTEVVCGQPT